MDELTRRLTERAEDVLGDRGLRHPGGESAGGATEPHRRRFHGILLLGAAALVALVTTGVLVARDDDPVVSTSSGHEEDPTEGPSEVVQAAIETTLARSWVADVEFPAPSEWRATVTYQPPGATDGVDGAVVQWASIRGANAPEYSIAAERFRLSSCVDPADCGGRRWSAIDRGDHFELESIVGAVDPSTATQVADGTIRAELRPEFTNACPGCEVRLTVSDGLVERLEYHTRGGVDAPWPEPLLELTMSFDDFGSAPAIVIPDESDIARSTVRSEAFAPACCESSSPRTP